MPLPISHLSTAKWFESVVKLGELKPRMCDVFAEEIVYLFYGGVFYRTSDNPTKDATQLPIAFLFHPSVLASIARYYPFDTGALAAGRYGKWSELLKPVFKDRFRVNGNVEYSVPGKIVHHVYGSNKRYVVGDVYRACGKKPEPLPQLCEFYNDDLTPLGVDHRQSIIECQSLNSVSLKRGLLWVGYPERNTKKYRPLFEKIREWTYPDIPTFYAYSSHKIYKPSEIAARLHDAAVDQVIKRFMSLPGEK
jgi:hypothetical protein